MELKDVIQKALLACGVEHDDLEFMSQAIEKEILGEYVLTPKTRPELIEAAAALERKLDELQAAILTGGEPEEALAEVLNEIEDACWFEDITFEKAEALKRARRKANYLQELLNRHRYKWRVRQLQNQLRKLLSPEAWDLFLELEEEMNVEMSRLRGGMFTSI